MLLHKGVGADHIVGRDALADADDQRHARGGRLADCVGREGRRHIDDRDIRAGLAHRFSHRVEHRHLAVDRRLAAAPRHDTGDDTGAIGDHLAGVELALAAGDALHDQPGICIDQDAHA